VATVATVGIAVALADRAVRAKAAAVNLVLVPARAALAQARAPMQASSTPSTWSSCE
jgi:hypothetical protein